MRFPPPAEAGGFQRIIPMNEALFLILTGLIGVGAGIATGILIAGLRAEKKDAPTVQKSQTNMIEVATIWQDRKSGNLFPELNGKVVRYPADLSASQRERLIGQLQTLFLWLSPVQEATQAPAEPQVEQPAPPYSPPTSHPPQPTKFSPIDMVARAVSPDAYPAAPEKSMLMQIDEILQEKLNRTPMAGQGIRLMDHPTKGLVVLVGLNQYTGVEEVPDPEIRNLIRESVAEWEKRSSPK
jgi:hypothetical protein